MSRLHDTVFIRGPAGSRPSGTRRVDDILIERTRVRLAMVAGLITAMALIALTIAHLMPRAESALEVGKELGPMVGLVIVGLTVLVLSLKRLVPNRLILGLGVLYELFVCFNVTLGDNLSSLALKGVPVIVTWAEPMIIFFALVVPLRPGLTVVAALAAAAMKPLAVVMAAHRIGLDVEYQWLIGTTVSGALAALLALIAARLIHGLGREVTRAQQLGSYRLVSQLGEGGMGEVWKASHKMLARPAAVKLIRPEMLGEDRQVAEAAIERFEREAQATSQLGSPHTVKLYDFGRADDGSFYYVMELLDGLDLSQLVHEHGPLPPERAIFLLRGVCHSLAEAHAAELIHRDIKPANIFACKVGLDHDVAKILDFGLVAPARRRDVRLTGAEVVVGTPAFIAPEAATNTEIDHRADLYAVGCVLYWMLTGELVFDEETPMAMAVAHATKEPPDPRDHNGEIPEALGELLARCLEKDPDDRPQSATELGELLSAIELDEPWTQERARAWWAARDQT